MSYTYDIPTGNNKICCSPDNNVILKIKKKSISNYTQTSVMIDG